MGETELIVLGIFTFIYLVFMLWMASEEFGIFQPKKPKKISLNEMDQKEKQKVKELGFEITEKYYYVNKHGYTSICFDDINQIFFLFNDWKGCYEIVPYEQIIAFFSYGQAMAGLTHATERYVSIEKWENIYDKLKKIKYLTGVMNVSIDIHLKNAEDKICTITCSPQSCNINSSNVYEAIKFVENIRKKIEDIIKIREEAELKNKPREKTDREKFEEKMALLGSIKKDYDDGVISESEYMRKRGELLSK